MCPNCKSLISGEYNMSILFMLVAVTGICAFLYHVIKGNMRS